METKKSIKISNSVEIELCSSQIKLHQNREYIRKLDSWYRIQIWEAFPKCKRKERCKRFEESKE